MFNMNEWMNEYFLFRNRGKELKHYQKFYNVNKDLNYLYFEVFNTIQNLHNEQILRVSYALRNTGSARDVSNYCWLCRPMVHNLFRLDYHDSSHSRGQHNAHLALKNFCPQRLDFISRPALPMLLVHHFSTYMYLHNLFVEARIWVDRPIWKTALLMFNYILTFVALLYTISSVSMSGF